MTIMNKLKDEKYVLYSKKYFLLNRAVALLGDLLCGIMFTGMALLAAYIIQCVAYF